MTTEQREMRDRNNKGLCADNFCNNKHEGAWRPEDGYFDGFFLCKRCGEGDFEAAGGYEGRRADPYAA